MIEIGLIPHWVIWSPWQFVQFMKYHASNSVYCVNLSDISQFQWHDFNIMIMNLQNFITIMTFFRKLLLKHICSQFIHQTSQIYLKLAKHILQIHKHNKSTFTLFSIHASSTLIDTKKITSSKRHGYFNVSPGTHLTMGLWDPNWNLVKIISSVIMIWWPNKV